MAVFHSYPKLCHAEFGAVTFFASSHPVESCGTNGLPLMPNSIRMLGHFQKLKTFIHPNLCVHLDMIRAKHERVIIVSEYYPVSLWDAIKGGKLNSSKCILKVLRDILRGLKVLHDHGISCRWIKPEHVLLDPSGVAKLVHYGIYYISEGGTCVSFPIGEPRYLAPETFKKHPKSFNGMSFKEDVWSIGILICEILSKQPLWNKLTLPQIISKIMGFSNCNLVFDKIVQENDMQNIVKELDPAILEIAGKCLRVFPRERATVDELLDLPIFEDEQLDGLGFWYQEYPIHPYCPPSDHLFDCSMFEVYWLWKLAGGDVVGELKKKGLVVSKPPILTLPKIVLLEGELFGQVKDDSLMLDWTTIILSQSSLRNRLKSIPVEAYYPLFLHGNSIVSDGNIGVDLKEFIKLPLVIRETDVEYQFYRIILFRRLLEGYPYLRSAIIKESRTDIPPLYRPLIWAALLNVSGSLADKYTRIDKLTPNATDRQIEVDVPRCHQYDELLSSSEAHVKFKRILKAWVASHPQYVYWQGLDSLCAPFLYLNFNDEALAYACLSAFIPKYLHNFFLKDNSTVIHEYLAKFSHMIAFHDPELMNHLHEIAFIPELYAIPWFLTMYTHVFPLYKIFHLWDTMLLGNSSFPLLIGVAILSQLRSSLLSFGFNECILLFSDMPEIDIEKCVQDSIKLFCSTPSSCSYRQHECPQVKKINYDIPPKLLVLTQTRKIDEPSFHDLDIDAVGLEKLKNEKCPRISARDTLQLLGLKTEEIDTEMYHLQHGKSKVVAIDIRPREEYIRGAIPSSINIPYEQIFNDSKTSNSPDCDALYLHKGKIIIIIGNDETLMVTFCEKLLQLQFPYVCFLHKGINILKSSGVLSVP